MFEVIPSPGTFVKDWEEFEKKIELVKPFAQTIHVDIVDGIFAPNTTFADPEPFKKFTKDMFFEVHLMTDDPIKHLKRWADAGFRRFIGHIEKMPDQEEFVAQAQLLGEVGLALDKQTPLEGIKVPYRDLDVLLVMLIQAGLSGQQFQEELLEKVKRLRIRDQVTLPIEVDGGINDETIQIAAAAGVNRFVVTSFVYNIETPEKQFQLLHKNLESLEGVV